MSGSLIRRSRAAMLMTAGAIALSTVTAGGAQAVPAAPEKCTIKGFTPSTFVVGATNSQREFKVQTSGCRQKNWRIDLVGGGTETLARKATPLIMSVPSELDNSMAGTYRAVIIVKSTDNRITKKKAFFSLLREATFGTTFSIGPESAVEGDTLNVVGKLQRASWGGEPFFGPYVNRNVQVQFRAVGTKTFKRVKTVKTDVDGDVITTVTANKSGTWRLRFAGNAATGPATSTTNGIRLGS
jgi:hypothetical protein